MSNQGLLILLAVILLGAIALVVVDIMQEHEQQNSQTVVENVKAEDRNT